MQNTKFNGEEVNIWSSAVLSGQSTHCCKQMEIKTPELEPGTRFDGFGYLVLSGAGTDMSQNPVMFSVQFRTSNPSATILKIAKSDESVVYMIYLNRGQVTIDYRINDLSRVRISSGKSYSNGKWVQVGYCLTSFYVTVGINVRNASWNAHSKYTLFNVPIQKCLLMVILWSQEREREMFYLTTHSTHFIYGYMASDIWLRTILIVRKETRCCHIGYSYRLTARVLLYAASHRQDSTYHGLCYTNRGALAGTRN